MGLQPGMVIINIVPFRTKMGDASIVVYLQHYILLKINVLTKLFFKVSFVPA